jgi:hypothetical protein
VPIRKTHFKLIIRCSLLSKFENKWQMDKTQTGTANVLLFALLWCYGVDLILEVTPTTRIGRWRIGKHGWPMLTIHEASGHDGCLLPHIFPC